jgi:hypothetical protein
MITHDDKPSKKVPSLTSNVSQHSESVSTAETAVAKPTFKEQLVTSCATDPLLESIQRQQSVIRGTNGGDAFLTSELSVTLSCMVKTRNSPEGGYLGELFCPVHTHMQAFCQHQVRQITFHGATSITGEQFLLVEKPGTGNSWNLSKQDAIQRGRGKPMILRSDNEKGVYRVEFPPVDIKNSLDEGRFSQLLEMAFTGLIIDTKEHAALRDVVTTEVWEA